jgi:serine protease Do
MRAVWVSRGLLACLLAFGLALSAGPAAARAVPMGMADLVAQLSPAVVNISTSQTINEPDDDGQAPGSPFALPPGAAPGQPEKVQSLGSGFVIDATGIIVTNNHVIDGADTIDVTFTDGTTLPAKLLGHDDKTDIAVLKVEPKAPLAFVSLGDSEKLRVGDWVMAIGNPFGLGGSVTLGIVSALNRDIHAGNYDDFIQTDASINRGNSGGPLFNMDGEVIGVNTAILSPNGGSIGIGFSMASNVVSKVVDQLKEYGETRRGWLGVRIQDVTEDVAEAIGLEKANGALVTDVPDGPAKDAGMKSGDVIMSFDGKEVVDTRGLVRQVGYAEVGKTVRVVVYRDGKTLTLKVTLGRREQAEAAVPAAQPGAQPGQEPAQTEMLGMTLSPLTDELRSELDLGEKAHGLVVSDIDELSQAYEKGLRAGDLITEAGQQKVDSIADLEDRVAEAKDGGRKSILLLVRRSGDPRFVALSLDDDEGSGDN